MSRYTTVKVWKLTPEQMAAYKPGMDLGEPDRIEKVKLVVFPDFDLLPEQRNGRGRGIRIKGRMTSRDYEMQRNRGLNAPAGDGLRRGPGKPAGGSGI